MEPENNKDTTGFGAQTPPDDSGKPDPTEENTGRQPTVGEPKKSKKTMWLLWILILLLILAAATFGWLWWQEKDKQKNTSTTSKPAVSEQQGQEKEAEAVACAEGLTAYENEDLGIAFCYPGSWGEVTVADAKFDAADTGQRWTVQFADKSMVNLGVVTEDWATEVARDGTCVDPAVQTLPAFSPFSTTWATEGTPVSSGTRGIEVEEDKYLISESVDDLLTNGVCLAGYTITGGEIYPHTAASYSVEFGGAVTTPQQHIDDPNVLIPEADREEFYAFVKSVRAL